MAWHATKVYVTIVIGFSKHESFRPERKLFLAMKEKKLSADLIPP